MYILFFKGVVQCKLNIFNIFFTKYIYIYEQTHYIEHHTVFCLVSRKDVHMFMEARIGLPRGCAHGPAEHCGRRRTCLFALNSLFHFNNSFTLYIIV